MKSTLDLVMGWIQKGESDLRAAVNTLETVSEPPLDIICFHAQQCAEKYLKAFLTFHNLEFPLTPELEDLTLLCSTININKDFMELVEKVKILTPYAVEIRYPEESPEISVEEAQSAVEIAREVKDLILRKLPSLK